MEEFDSIVRRRIDDSRMDLVADCDRAHGLGRICQSLGHGHHIGGHTERLRCKRRSQSTKATDDFIKNQQDTVDITDLAQPLKITGRRYQATGRAGDRLDDTGSDGVGPLIHGDALRIDGP